VRTGSYRIVRGRTLLAVILDEGGIACASTSVLMQVVTTAWAVKSRSVASRELTPASQLSVRGGRGPVRLKLNSPVT
jgi:hypothetical protein